MADIISGARLSGMRVSCEFDVNRAPRRSHETHTQGARNVDEGVVEYE
jgi:hypothetical protein